MPDNLKFYPEQKSVPLNPMNPDGELKYFLEGFSGEISQKEITLKYAFPAKLGTTSQAVKEKIRNILIQVLDITHFSVTSERGKATISVPIARLSDPSLLPDQEDTIKVPILVKLIKAATEEEEQVEFKCSQELLIETSYSDGDDYEETTEDYTEEEEEDDSFDDVVE